MHALKPRTDHEEALPDKVLSVAKASLRPGPGFLSSRLDGALAGPCRTQAKPSAGGDRLLRRADHNLVVRLCSLPPDLAAPLLRSTLPALNSAALLTVLAATGEAHHRLVAARRGIDWRVAKAAIRYGHPAALRALAENLSIDLDDEDQATLAGVAEHDEALRAALLARPGMRVAHSRLLPSPEGLSHSNLKLIKLMRAGEETAFIAETARRLKADADRIAAAMAAPSAVPLALAACALGLDRAVFLDLLHHRQAARGEPVLNAAHQPMVLSVFALGPDEARRRLLVPVS